jgi:hypothetical protein
MKRSATKVAEDDLRREYNFGKLEGGVRGKYARRYKAGTNIIRLSPDVAPYFPDEESVNDALRSLISLAERKAHAKS